MLQQQHDSVACVMAVQKERWDGAWLGAAAAEQVFKADAVHSILEVTTLGAVWQAAACWLCGRPKQLAGRPPCHVTLTGVLLPAAVPFPPLPYTAHAAAHARAGAGR
jgi:hypothetical protein